MKLFKRSVKTQLKEMRNPIGLGLRRNIDALKGSFFQSPSLSVLRDTTIDYETARSLYYNTNLRLSNGAFFAKSIIDGTADVIGIPIVSTGDQSSDDILSHLINDRWKAQLWDIYRIALRDTCCWVRIRKPFNLPTSADDENNDVVLEVINAESVTPYYDPVTKELIRAEIVSDVFVEEQPFSPSLITSAGARVYGREHQIVEIITPQQYLYYDKTLQAVLDEYTIDNKWGFVPLVQVFNDFDSTLNGGSSDLESVYPFLQAFHDLLVQSRTSHTYHADPKVKFKLEDVNAFLRNNFPESFNAEGDFSGVLSWKGKDIYLMESTEDVGFIEANLNMNDSVALMEFIIDCICIAGEITVTMLFRSKAQVGGQTDEMFRFKKKIERKRNNFAEYIQEITKLALIVLTGRAITTPKVSWLPVQDSDALTEGQAMNQVVTAAEVAQRAGAISIDTYRSKIRPFFPQMQDNDTEAQAAQKDIQDEQDRQLALEKQLAQIQQGAKPTQTVNGVNGAGHISRARLPIDIVPTSLGN